MNVTHAGIGGIMVDIAKGWRPNMYLTNVLIAAFQQAGYYVAPAIFPVCPVGLSAGQYYIFNKAELAKDQVGRKPAFGKVDPAVFSHTEETYSCKVDQIIIGIDDIAALNYQRSRTPASIDPRRAKARLASEQIKLHLDRIFAKAFFRKEVWGNVKTGTAGNLSAGQFGYFSDANTDIIGLFDDYKRDILVSGRRLPNRLTLGYDAYVGMKNHPQFLERVTGSGSTPNPALVNEQVIAAVLGIDNVKVLYSTENAAELGQTENMQFVFDSRSALLSYAPAAPAIDEPSAGYIFTWDMLGDGNWMATSTFQGEGGTHSEFIEGLMAYDMKKTCDDLAIFLDGCVA
ncbi:MAG: hypothetical protein HFH59_09285 [Lachnospiraceae bacterium]|nr:hypothetical protein [Lachnospiraceae bacterium]